MTIRPIWAPTLCAAMALAGPALAQPAVTRQPVLEAGIGGGGGWLPDYPAAGQNHLQGLAFPYVIYRGEILRSDDRGVRSRFYSSEGIGLDLSFSGAFPSRSDDNKARRGMPDLDWQAEVGPSLRLTLWRDMDTPQRLNLELPVRAVFSTDLSSIHYRGITLSPELAWERLNLGGAGTRLRLGLGPIFATNRLMDYYYEVQPQYALPDRPAYNAKGGYLGTRLQFSYRLPLTERIAMVAGGRLENFSGARNDDSPLFRRDWNLSLALGFSWTLYRSEATVASTASPFD
ncbi:MipA/OmpV family protein [Teichococcus wenyumeiae]|uniref:MipA/OmpV family protein n=1 Tax=Teichococcus wenyumeiae TaxID=2478470 RepID=UPI00131446D4|nr:MipA/OmpV family protein [Pseudoroseomonas wenyumeiae]